MREPTEFATKEDIQRLYSALTAVLEVAVVAFYGPALGKEAAVKRFDIKFEEAIAHIRRDLEALDVEDKNG